MKKKKPYVRPVSTCTPLTLESAICSGSNFRVGTESDTGITAHEVDTDFTESNNFLGKDDAWN